MVLKRRKIDTKANRLTAKKVTISMKVFCEEEFVIKIRADKKIREGKLMLRKK